MAEQPLQFGDAAPLLPWTMFAGHEEDVRWIGAGDEPPVAYSLDLVWGPTCPSTAIAVEAWYSRTA